MYLVNKSRRDELNGYANLRKSLTSATVYVGHLMLSTTEEQIYEHFAQAGRISRVIMGLNAHDQSPTGFCFVVFKQPQAALNAVKYLNKTKINGRTIEIDLDPGFEDGRQYGRGENGAQKGQMYLHSNSGRRGGYNGGGRGGRRRRDRDRDGARDRGRERGPPLPAAQPQQQQYQQYQQHQQPITQYYPPQQYQQYPPQQYPPQQYAQPQYQQYPPQYQYPPQQYQYQQYPPQGQGQNQGLGQGQGQSQGQGNGQSQYRERQY